MRVTYQDILYGTIDPTLRRMTVPLVIPQVGNSAIRATGDTRLPRKLPAVALSLSIANVITPLAVATLSALAAGHRESVVATLCYWEYYVWGYVSAPSPGLAVT